MAKERIMGGFLLRTQDLLKQLTYDFEIPEEKTIGIAFRIPKRKVGNHLDVNVDIVRVWLNQEGKLQGKKIKMRKRGASYRYHKQIRNKDLDLFKFQYKKILNEKKFEFSFFGKNELNLLLENCGKEVFISGTTVSFGEVSKVRGKHFSLMIEHVPNNKPDNAQEPIPLGQYTFSVGVPCPPTWCFGQQQKDRWNLITKAVMDA